jgi:WD40 repeat protein
MRVWQAHERAVLGLAFAPDGSALATHGDEDPAARIWDLAAGDERFWLSLLQEAPSSLAFTPDGETLAVGRPEAVELWDTATGGLRRRLHVYQHHSASLAYAADGRSLLSAGTRRGGPDSYSVQGYMWDVATGRTTVEFAEPVLDPFGLACALDSHTLLWAPNDTYLTTANTVTLIDVPAEHPWAVLEVPGPVHAAALALDGRTLAAAIRGDVHVWGVGKLAAVSKPLSKRGDEPHRRGRVLRAPTPPQTLPSVVLPGAAERIDAVAFTPDGRWLLAGGAVGSVRVWAVPDLSLPPPPPEDFETETLPPPEVRTVAAFDWGIGPVTALAVAPDGLTAAAGSRTGQVVVWDLDS